MNRRDFLRLSLLVPVALSTKLQVEPEKFEIISPSETFNKAFEGWTESFQKGYEMGQRVMWGYVEGVQSPIGSVQEGQSKYMIPSDKDENGNANWKLEHLGSKSEELALKPRWIVIGGKQGYGEYF